MKLWQIVGGAAALTITLAGCAQKSAYVPTQAAGNPAAAQTQIQGPAVTGSVNIRQRIALPPDAVLTVTLSDASLADAPSKVIAQRAVRTEGQQAPFSFTLPYNPSDIQPNARIILSAAVTVKGRLMFITDTIQKWSTATAPVPICCWFRFRVCRFRLRQPPCSNLTAVQQDEINSLCASAKGCFVLPAPAVAIEIDRAVRAENNPLRQQCLPLPLKILSLLRYLPVAVDHPVPGSVLPSGKRRSTPPT